MPRGTPGVRSGNGDSGPGLACRAGLSSAERFSRVLRQRRQNQQPMAKMLQRLRGLEAKMKQYEQGERFMAVRPERR